LVSDVVSIEAVGGRKLLRLQSVSGEGSREKKFG
jgi:hypothetical protein